MNDKEKGNQLTMTSSEWQYGDANFVDSSIRLGHGENPMSVCASGSMMDSFCHSVWEHPSNSQPLGFSEMDVHNVASTSESFRMGVEANFDASSLMFKTGLFLPSLTGVLPHSLSQFPADSGFIERAARFSSFNGGNFSDMVNPFGIHQHPNPYLQGGSPLHMARPSIDVSLNEEHRAAEGSPSKDERKHEKSCDEPNHGARVSGNDSDEADFSAGRSRGQEDEDPSSGKGLSSKKRKRGGQDTEPEKANGAQQQTSEQNEDCNPTSTPKTSARHGKQASQALDSPTDEYIHVRARRGQATNSHSLAERVRREKISERMKFLQDLVPGCSKVTGKAVMLDEIINYVQSLQRQVEFLSMKLATVNPRLDVNIERLLAKDQLFSAQPGPPLALRFSPSMPIPYIPMNPPQPSILEPGNSSDLLRRTVDSHLTSMNLGYKEPSPQVPNVWEDELHNVVQMGCNAGTPPTGQDTNSTLPRGHMKTEP